MGQSKEKLSMNGVKINANMISYQFPILLLLVAPLLAFVIAKGSTFTMVEPV